MREVKEETGYDVDISRLLHNDSAKFSFIAEVTGGELHLDKNNEDNQDIIEAACIPIIKINIVCLTPIQLHI
ncbi:hypothetical protein [Peribacillus deserti]|uniref:hypothetical protein n=1 Tax=Peribacillus deserti TaxID=673318 RepID=UPI003083F7A5